MNAFNMTCEAVQVTLPDYLDETLEAWVRTSVQEHLSECMTCAALVRDLRNIQREAAALPDLVPAHDLWPGIESRIGTPVVSFTPAFTPAIVSPTAPLPSSPTAPPPGTPVVALHRRRLAPVWLGAAAAALVVLTAGTTYLLTAHAVKPGATPNVASAVTSKPAASSPDVDSGISAAPTETEPRRSGISGAAQASGRAVPGRRVPRLVSRSPAEAVYEKEIAMLQTIMSWRKAQLDPSTAAIIEKNLKIIDAAITESKAALRNDPASSMLSDQLSNALDKKVQLLRTAAMLPAST